MTDLIYATDLQCKQKQKTSIQPTKEEGFQTFALIKVDIFILVLLILSLNTSKISGVILMIFNNESLQIHTPAPTKSTDLLSRKKRSAILRRISTCQKKEKWNRKGKQRIQRLKEQILY